MCKGIVGFDSAIAPNPGNQGVAPLLSTPPPAILGGMLATYSTYIFKVNSLAPSKSYRIGWVLMNLHDSQR